MKKFKFRLDPVLKLRKYNERKAQIEVAKVLADIAKCEQKIAACETQYTDAATELSDQLGKGIEAYKLAFYQNYFSGKRKEIETESQRRQHLQGNLRNKQKILTKKSIEKKVIENLKSRKQSEYYETMAKNLHKENDDMIVFKKARTDANETESS